MLMQNVVKNREIRMMSMLRDLSHGKNLSEVARRYRANDLILASSISRFAGKYGIDQRMALRDKASLVLRAMKRNG